MFALKTFWNLPLLSVSFSTAADANQQIPHVTDTRALVLTLDTTFPSSVHCREAANTAKQLLFMIHQSFTELSKAAFIPLDRVIMRPHLGYAMDTNAPALRVDINKLEGVQRLATWIVRVLRLVLYEERLRQFTIFSLERRRLRPGLEDFPSCS